MLDHIVPAVAHLRSKYPINFNVLFTEAFLATGPSSSSSLDCTDVHETDRFFDSFYFEYVIPWKCHPTADFSLPEHS